jgi:transcriptional regulator with XRE-family HTH domain
VHDFGKKLRDLRIRHNLTLKELARLLGYTSHGHLSEIEAGKKKPTAEFVLGVARLFGISTDSLMKDELEVDAENSRLEQKDNL